MKSFEGSPRSFISDNYSDRPGSLPADYLEKLRLELAHEQEYLQLQAEDLQQKMKTFARQKENFENNYKSRLEHLRIKEIDLAKQEAEFYKVYENFEGEKEKWKKILDGQLEDIESRELELEVQREELATELEKCQILGENLHKIQSEIRNKALSVNEREKNLKIAEERNFMVFEDLIENERRFKEKKILFDIREKENLNIIEDIEQKSRDIQKTSKMFEKINSNLLTREEKLQKDQNFLKKGQFQLEKDKKILRQNFNKLEKWQKDLESRGKLLKIFEGPPMIKLQDHLKDVPSVTTEEDDECCVIGINILTPRSNESTL
jgi:chromosome segregation ATPase